MAVCPGERHGPGCRPAAAAAPGAAGVRVAAGSPGIVLVIVVHSGSGWHRDHSPRRRQRRESQTKSGDHDGQVTQAVNYRNRDCLVRNSESMLSELEYQSIMIIRFQFMTEKQSYLDSELGMNAPITEVTEPAACAELRRKFTIQNYLF